MDTNDFDTIPVRLPSGTKAVVQLPRPFTTDDAKHLLLFLEQYIEDAQRSPLGAEEGIDGDAAEFAENGL